MTAKEHYILAYRTFRASKGSVSLRGDKPIRAAWNTYRDEFIRPPHVTSEDPLGCSKLWIKRVRAGCCQMSYARYQIHLLYHFNTDYLLSDVHYG